MPSPALNTLGGTWISIQVPRLTRPSEANGVPVTAGALLQVSLAETLARHHPILLIERTKHFNEVREFLAPFGYQPFTYDAERDELSPHGGEAAQNVFFVAEDGDPSQT